MTSKLHGNGNHAQGLPPETPDRATDDWSDETQELIDGLPQVWTRGLLYFLVVFMSIILPWAMLSKVDEIGSASGRLEPQGKTLRLDTEVAGRVAAIKVKAGQTIKKGQTLLELDSKIARTQLQQAQVNHENLLNRANKLEQVKNNLQSEYLAQRDQIQQQINSSREIYEIDKNDFNVARRKTQRYEPLMREGVISPSELEERKGALYKQERQLKQSQSDIRQALTELEKQQSAYQKELKNHQLQISEVRSQIAGNEKQIDLLKLHLGQRVLVAPVSGIVFQLPIQRIGAVVQPKDLVAEIAPQGSPLIIRAQISTAQSGSLREGLPVKLKFDSYPFQDYGVVEGKVEYISPTTVEADKSNGEKATYTLEIALKQHCILTKTKCIELRPGDTATAEVILRQRRLIDFILDPFKKLQKGGLEL